jgi:hypothetical protein
METSKTSTRQLTLDELISSQEGSHVNPIAQQDESSEKMMTATCGPRCCALLENAPRVTSWAKTFAALLVGMEGWSSKRCALTWKLSGTPYNRVYLVLQASTLRTNECEYGSLPTPNAFDWNTPRSDEAWERSKDKWGDSLHTPLKQLAAQGLLPTPATRDYKGANSMEHLTRESSNRNHLDQLPNAIKLATGNTSQLNPLFVEEMMGFPENWTLSPFLNGVKNPSKDMGTP